MTPTAAATPGPSTDRSTDRIILSVPVPRGVHEQLEARRAPHTPIEQTAAAHLQLALRFDPPAGGRTVPLNGYELEQLEAILGGGSILHAPDLLQKVQRLAGISCLHVRLPFTPNQLEALAVRAERQGQTIEQLVERAAPRIYEQFFNLIS